MAAAPLVIVGSSQEDAAHMSVMREVLGREYKIIHLNQYDVGYYDYQNRNQGDDFLSIAQQMADVDRIILATPIYWYSMSAQLKTFLDRWTDLITIRKEIGRKLEGKRLFVLAWGNAEALPEGFEVPFVGTADYFAMRYAGCFYYCTGSHAKVEQRQREAVAFGRTIMLPE
jgi:putative NADPH-quinone reductase